MRYIEEVFSNVKPSEIDIESSPTTIYVRKNIQQVTEKTMEGETDNSITLWKYEEYQYTVEEYCKVSVKQLIEKNVELDIVKTQNAQMMMEIAMLRASSSI